MAITAKLNPGSGSSTGMIIVSGATNGETNQVEIDGSGLVTGSTLTFASSYGSDSFPTPSGPCVATLVGSTLKASFQCRRTGSTGVVTITITVHPPVVGAPSSTTISDVNGLVLDFPNDN